MGAPRPVLTYGTKLLRDLSFWLETGHFGGIMAQFVLIILVFVWESGLFGRVKAAFGLSNYQ